MRRLFFLLVLLLPACQLLAAPAPRLLRPVKGGYTIDTLIPFHPGDNPAWASPLYDDRSWGLENPSERLLTKVLSSSPASWWRFSFVLDSKLARKPLSIDVSGAGSSEVYLDGVLLQRFGERQDSARATTRSGDPFIFAAPAAGTHLLAIRYTHKANISKRREISGFYATIGEANGVAADDREQISFGVATLMLLCGLFLAFGVLHLIMFFYYRTLRSNMWFAAFSLFLAAAFAMFALKVSRLELTGSADFGKTILILLSLTCYSLSGLVNNLFFNKRSWWLRVLLLSGLMLSLLLPRYGYTLIGIGIFAAAMEAMIILLLAVYRRKPGARIIASGMLLFAALIVVVLVIATTVGASRLVANNVVGLITVLLLATAIISIPLSMSAYLAWNNATLNKSLKSQLAELERLSEETRRQEAERQRLLETRQEELEREVASRTEELRGQKQKSDDLLLNILPAEIAEELKERGSAAARQYEHVSVLFTDFADFTQHSESLSPEALIRELDECFRAFDGIIERHGLEKIKTVGDAYIAVCGLPVSNEHHALAAVRAALEIRDFMQARAEEQHSSFHIRLGIHSGPVIAGIVGVKKFAYDIWGDTVNTAARMEQHSEAGQLNISAATHELIRGRFSCIYRGELEAKHKGRLGMYFVEAELPFTGAEALKGTLVQP